jgi:hypothetical protein
MKATTLAGGLLLLAVTACGGPAATRSGSVTVLPDPSASASSTQLPGKATVHAYFDGVASGALSGYEDAKSDALPGSPADRYLTYLRAAAEAVRDSGTEVSPSGVSAEVDDGAYRFCNGSGSDQVCYRYTDITGAAGKVVDFSVNGRPVAERLAVGSGSPVPASGVDGAATFVAAFERTEGDELFVAVRVEAGAADLSGVEATYATASEAPAASTRMSGARAVAAGSAGNYVFAFADAHLGGTLSLALHGGGGSTGTVDLPIS